MPRTYGKERVHWAPAVGSSGWGHVRHSWIGARQIWLFYLLNSRYLEVSHPHPLPARVNVFWGVCIFWAICIDELAKTPACDLWWREERQDRGWAGAGSWPHSSLGRCHRPPLSSEAWLSVNWPGPPFHSAAGVVLVGFPAHNSSRFSYWINVSRPTPFSTFSSTYVHTYLHMC